MWKTLRGTSWTYADQKVHQFPVRGAHFLAPGTHKNMLLQHANFVVGLLRGLTRNASKLKHVLKKHCFYIVIWFVRCVFVGRLVISETDLFIFHVRLQLFWRGRKPHTHFWLKGYTFFWKLAAGSYLGVNILMLPETNQFAERLHQNQLLLIKNRCFCCDAQVNAATVTRILTRILRGWPPTQTHVLIWHCP